MKNLILLFFIAGCILNAYGQDSIYLVNKNYIVANVTGFVWDEVAYKTLNNDNGKENYEKKKNISYIRYSTGDIEFYEEPENFRSGTVVEKGEQATIVLLSGNIINCEIIDMSDFCVVYKENTKDARTLVFMKYVIDKIYRKDSSYSTFSEYGKEIKHEKPVPKVEIVNKDSIAKAQEEKKTEPVSVETKPVVEEPKKPSSSDTKKILKGDCELLDPLGTSTYVKDVTIDIKNNTISYFDNFDKSVTKRFGEIAVIYYQKGNNPKHPLYLKSDPYFKLELDDL